MRSVTDKVAITGVVCADNVAGNRQSVDGEDCITGAAERLGSQLGNAVKEDSIAGWNAGTVGTWNEARGKGDVLVIHSGIAGRNQ